LRRRNEDIYVKIKLSYSSYAEKQERKMAGTLTATEAVPTRITLDYRETGDLHVFTAREVGGLHITGHALEETFNLAFAGLSAHVSELYGREVKYSPAISFDEFERHLHKQAKQALPKETIIAKKVREDA
jgi:hypothetical protein